MSKCRKYGCSNEGLKRRENFCGWGCRGDFYSDPVNKEYENIINQLKGSLTILTHPQRFEHQKISEVKTILRKILGETNL
jgi:hypothetical protein